MTTNRKYNSVNDDDSITYVVRNQTDENLPDNHRVSMIVTNYNDINALPPGMLARQSTPAKYNDKLTLPPGMLARQSTPIPLSFLTPNQSTPKNSKRIEFLSEGSKKEDKDNPKNIYK